MRAAATALRSIAAALAGVLVLSAAATSAPRELRVCADPDNLPFSNEKLQGFENRLVDLVAADLQATVKYAWFRQRRGFIRRTLNANACDVVTAIPPDTDMALTTNPYYRSAYVFVYRTADNLHLRSFDDPVLRQLRIGLHALGEDGANPPPAHALARRGIITNVVGFPMWDVEGVINPQGRIIEAVAKGDIDVAIVWGPFGGYFSQRQTVGLSIVPVSPAVEPTGIPFAYDISMGVRTGNTVLKSELDGILARRQKDIRKILDDYRIPIVDATAASPSPKEIR